MKEQNKFAVEIYQLKNKQYSFDYEIDNSFFAGIENSLIQKGKLQVRLELVKSEQMLQLTFLVHGVVELMCDRSLEPFDFPIEVKDKIIYKFGDEEKEIADDMYMIKKETLFIDISHPLYELIAVTIPYKKLHPRFRIEESGDDKEVELIYQSDKSPIIEEPTEDNIDPRWKELLKLRKN